MCSVGKHFLDGWRRDEQAGTGQAQAQFKDGKITSLRLGPLPPNP